MKIKAEALAKNPALIEYEKAKKCGGKMLATVPGGNTGTLLQLK